MRDGPFYDATLKKMVHMPELWRNVNRTVVRYGAIVIRSPVKWTQPPDSYNLATSVETSKQRFTHPRTQKPQYQCLGIMCG